MVHSTVLYLMYCAGPLAVKNLVDWHLDRMSGDSEPGSGSRLLEWWSSGREEVLQLGSAADSYKKVGSGAYIVGVVDHPYLATRLPLWLTLSSYASTMPVVLVVRDASTGEGIGLTCELGNRDVERADPTEQELGNWDVARVDPTEQEFGNYDVGRADPTEQELGNRDIGKDDPTEQELGNWDVARVDPSERELGNCDVGRADPTEQELGNWDGARVDSIEHELGNHDVARADPTEQELGNWDSDFRQGRTWAQTLGFGQGGELGRKSGDLAERVNSGANMEIWPSK
ncbi:hypothetical protein BHM03_00028092 [Ensete ventricosum]|uniref:Uncharacterized protein n=1 Tax=Ensete ventricosum TaxID=4639 RepID=A0A445MHM3_ENSVE|nr:hypothetical protein BHM03_00028092 [Ensete ventricosum]